ncbi:hypothetical protein MNB_SUP05-4-1099 [hydrothermal vent metagenome]|uniref:Uncharacterized protein n=1 Tax=hydrothermal vent metagenome TaxID=652676 RepID=A0A1W1DAJ8_9ZZZZ
MVRPNDKISNFAFGVPIKQKRLLKKKALNLSTIQAKI